MSIEYTAAASLSETQRARLIEALCQDHEMCVVRVSGKELSLRFAENAARLEWPEDVRVYFGDAVDVNFDSGSRQQRESFLGTLRGHLQALGIDLVFEEI